MKAFRTLLCSVLALLLLAAQAPLAIAQDSGTAAPTAAQPAPAEPGWLGTEMQELDAASIKALGLDQPHALLVILTVPDGPADKAGLKTADAIVAVNGQPVPDLTSYPANKASRERRRIPARNLAARRAVAIAVGLGSAKEARA